MRKLILLLGLASYAHAGFTLVNDKGFASGSPISLGWTTTAGDVGVLCLIRTSGSGTAITSVTENGSRALLFPSQFNSTQAGTLSGVCTAFLLGGGANSISWTLNGTWLHPAAWFGEFHSTAGSITLSAPAGSTANNGASTNNWTAPSLVLGSPNSLVLQVAMTGAAISSVSGGYFTPGANETATNDQARIVSASWQLSDSTGTGPTWRQPTNASLWIAMSFAFAATSSGGSQTIMMEDENK